MMQRSWKNVALIVLGLVVIIGLFFAAFMVTSLCSHGVDWPICFMQ